MAPNNYSPPGGWRSRRGQVLAEYLELELGGPTLPKAIAVLKAIVENGEAKHSDRLRAIEILFDRVYGRPVQDLQVETTTVHNGEFDLSKLSDSELRALVALTSKVTGVAEKDIAAQALAAESSEAVH